MERAILLFSIFSFCFSESNAGQLSIKINTEYDLFDSREWIPYYKGKEISEGKFYEMTKKVKLQKKYNIYMNKRKNGIIRKKDDTSTPQDFKWKKELLPSVIISSIGLGMITYARLEHSYYSYYNHHYFTDKGLVVSLLGHTLLIPALTNILVKGINHYRHPKINFVSHKDAMALSVKFNLK